MHARTSRIGRSSLRIAQSVVQIPPPESSSDQPGKQTLSALIYEPLIGLRDCHPVPALAQSWEVEDDGRKWRFPLRSGATFHDGRPCTAEDVVLACRRLLDAEGPFDMEGPYVPYFEEMEVEAADRHTVTISGDDPMGYILEICAGVVVGEGPRNGQLPVGTGPYCVADYVPGEYLSLAAVNEKEGLPYQDIFFTQITDPKDRLNALKSGQVDVVTGLESLPQPLDLRDLVARRAVNTLSVTAFFNGFTEPFSQPEARLAFNLAIDVDSIIREVWGGLAIPATTIVSPNHRGYPSNLSPSRYDPEGARRLLEGLDLPGALNMRTPHITPDRALQVTQMIVDQLDRIGVRINIDQQRDRQAYAQEVGSKKIGHLAIFDSSPLSTYRVLREKVSSRAKGLWWQGVVDDTADQLIEEASGAYDVHEQGPGYGEILSWLNANPHWLYLYHPVKLWAHDPKIEGVTMDAGGMLRMPGLS